MHAVNYVNAESKSCILIFQCQSIAGNRYAMKIILGALLILFIAFLALLYWIYGKLQAMKGNVHRVFSSVILYLYTGLQIVSMQGEVTDGQVVRAGISVTKCTVHDLEVMSSNPVGSNLGCVVLLS